MLGAGMFKTLGCVILDATEAQPYSQRLRAFAGRNLAGKPLVDWVVRRATEAERLDGVVVILPDERQGQEIEGLVPADVMLYVSNQRDHLARVRDCLETFMTEAMVRVRLDCPLADPSLIDRLVTAADRDPTVDFAAYCSGAGLPAVQSPLGLCAEFYSTSAIRRADRMAKTARERRDFARFIMRHSDHFRVKMLPIPEPLDRDDLRLSLRHQDDWEHAEQIVEALGTDGLDWPRIASLLEQQPGLRQRMAVLNRAGL